MTGELDRLEEKIRATVGYVARLREEKRRLEAENKELREQIRTLVPAAAKHADDLKPRLKALEEERSTLLDERRAVARRVEEMLTKLDLLQKAVHA
jgi:predicted  nucleic acid-binding Zn-ribbon protein